MALTLPADYLAELIERRLPPMLAEVSSIALQDYGLTVGDRVYPYFNPAAPDLSWQIIHQSVSLTRDRAAADQYLTTHALVLRFIGAAVDGGFWGKYPGLYNVLAPTVVAYLVARPRFIYQQGQSSVPFLAAEQTIVSGAQFFGDTIGGSTPVQGIDFSLSVAFRVKIESSAVNP
jgi:hypothetical protein